jgi:hypothetical protein
MKEQDSIAKKFKKRNVAESIQELRELYPTIRVLGDNQLNQPAAKSLIERKNDARIAAE